VRPWVDCSLPPSLGRFPGKALRNKTLPPGKYPPPENRKAPQLKTCRRGHYSVCRFVLFAPTPTSFK